MDEKMDQGTRPARVNDRFKIERKMTDEANTARYFFLANPEGSAARCPITTQRLAVADKWNNNYPENGRENRTRRC